MRRDECPLCEGEGFVLFNVADEDAPCRVVVELKCRCRLVAPESKKNLTPIEEFLT